jgi:endonuclease I
MKKIYIVLIGLFILGCSSEETPEPKPTPTPGSELEAVDDTMTAIENEEILLPDLLKNDNIVDRARITEIDAETAKGGTVVNNKNGTYSYFPPANYTGEDSFFYTICVPGDSDICATAEVLVTIEDAGEPVAVDDAYTTEEEQILVISGHLSNDNVVDNASVTEVYSETGNAVVSLENDGSIKYIPNNGFAGEDSFTYTLCDDDEEANCSTATVTITVEDEGTPVANADVVSMAAGETELTISTVLSNDNLIDDAELVSAQNADHGSVVLNSDGTITYTAETGFVGDATFTYTLCDDDAEPACFTAEVTVKIVETISFNIPSELNYYYSDAVFSDDETILYQELAAHTNENHVNKLEYYMRHDYLYDADEDINNPDNVILMYSGESRPEDEYWQGSTRDEWETFNTEHIYPQSRLEGNIDFEEAKNDLHHLRSADIDVNEMRSNYPYTEGSGTYELINGNSWYPGDDWRGDVARMVMYVNLKYGEPFSDVGNLQMFLRWNVEDPVSEFELQRQEIIESAQGNRNPFIDNPYLATLIWGGDAAENKWE